MEEFDWNTQNECYLLESMSGHKPIGINKAFQMLCIYDKFKERIEKEVLSQVIWKHLGTMYNLEALDDSESLPFPNDEVEFELPDIDFASLKQLKLSQKIDEIKPEELPTIVKDHKLEDKVLVNLVQDTQRRDSKDSRSSSTSSKKDKEVGKIHKDKSNKTDKTKNSNKSDTPKSAKKKDGEKSGKPSKRPTRGSLKADDSSSSGKSSPVTITPQAKKRRLK